MRKVAESTVRRLSLYLRFLEEFDSRGVATVSSGELAARGGTTSAQVRKDLSFFGSFGKRGMGYAVSEMVAQLREILGLDRRWRVALLGAGKIGTALVEHGGFRDRGFDIVAVFDNDPRKVGTGWNGLVVQDESTLEARLSAEPVEIAIVAVPAGAAQPLATRLVAVGVSAILNVAPVQLVVPPEVEVKTVSLAMELEGLSFALTNR
jgi:redox-sensing transcriptional repressor